MLLFITALPGNTVKITSFVKVSNPFFPTVSINFTTDDNIYALCIFDALQGNVG